MEFTNQTILFGIFDSSSSVEKKIKKKMEITNFDFSPSDLNLLKTNGFSSVDDFQGFFMRFIFFQRKFNWNYFIFQQKKGFNPFDLAKELDLKDIEKATYILEKINNYKSNPNRIEGKTVLEMIEQQQNHIFTFSKELDEMLEGGIPLKQITEFCGGYLFFYQSLLFFYEKQRFFD